MILDRVAPLCETKDIRKDFELPDNQVMHVLENMNVQVYPDEILAIIGPSGCGKSTFLRILAGLIPPTSGQIYYHGKQVTGLLPNFSLVFQNFALYPWMTVKQNIEMVLEAKGLSKEKIQTTVHEAIAMIGLSGFEESYPREISGGMKQRVGLARALVCDPEILLLDEPFSSLDAFTTEILQKELLNVWADNKYGLSSIVIISHDVREVAFLADRILMMDANPGRVRFVMENKLPRPRDYHSPDFLKLVDQLHDAYLGEEAPTTAPITPLIFVTPEEIYGFLLFLKRSGESNDLYQMGAGSVDLFKRVWMDAKACEQLNFAKMTKRTITILDVGKKYLVADAQNRRLIWKEQLLTIPLFVKALEWIKSSPNHQLTAKELTDLIKMELPHKDAKLQAKALISWGAYSYLFNYHRPTKTLSLRV